ncbi:MAG: MFS transporter [Elusimicrobiota bacterium]|jgi:hypothetical protein
MKIAEGEFIVTRILAAFLLLASCWPPAAAAVVVAAGASAQASVLPPSVVLTAGALSVVGPQGVPPGIGVLDVSPGGMLVALPTPKPAPGAAVLPMAFRPGTPAAAESALPVARKAAAVVRVPAAVLPGPVSPDKEPSVFSAASGVYAELSKVHAGVSRGGGGADASSSEQVDALRRLFDGAARLGVVEDPVSAAVPAGTVELLRLDGSEGPAAPRRPLPPPAARPEALRKAMLGTAFYKFGMESLSIAMPLIILNFFGGATLMVTAAAVWTLSMTATTMGSGGLIDRAPVQKVMGGALLAEAAAVSGIIALLTLGTPHLGVLLPLYALAGAAQGVAVTALDTFPVLLMGPDQDGLERFNANVYLSYQGAGILAPALVGLLIGLFGVVAGLAVTPPAFLLSAWAFSRLKIDPAAEEELPESPSFRTLVREGLAELKEGARIMMDDRERRWLGVMLVGPMLLHRIVKLMMAPIFAKSVLHASAYSAWISGLSNLGELAGATLLLSPKLSAAIAKNANSLVWIRTMALTALGIWAFAAGTLWSVLPAIFLMGLSYATNKISVTSHLQSRLPDASAGKAIAFLDAVGLGVLMVAGALFGVLFDLLPPVRGLVVAAAVLSVLSVVFYAAYLRLRLHRAGGRLKGPQG